MNFALDVEGNRISASPGGMALCPLCDSVVYARLERTLRFSWKHRNSQGGYYDCDPWIEPDSPWLFHWFGKADESLHEIPMAPPAGDGAPRLIDVRSSGGHLMEFQDRFADVSNVAFVPQLAEREAFFGPSLVWLFNASEWEPRLTFQRSKGVYAKYSHTFTWAWPCKSLWPLRQPIYWHFPGAASRPGWLFRIGEWAMRKPFGGSGDFLSPKEFARQFLC